MSKQIEHSSTLIDQKGSDDILNIFVSLLTLFRLDGVLSEYSIPFLEGENILTEILSMEHPTNIYCLITLSDLIREIIPLEKAKWIDDMVEKLKNIDYQLLRVDF